MKRPPPPRVGTTVIHNFTGSNALVIPASSTDNYTLTGTYNSAGHAVTVGLGYKGTITLSNAKITTLDNSSCIRYVGGIGDLPISTDSVLHLIGNNVIWGSKGLTDFDWPGISIEAGVKLTIDGYGNLDARMGNDKIAPPDYNNGSGPAIGASSNSRGSTGVDANGRNWDLAGGDLIIKSGTITARGSTHATAIGGGGHGSMRRIIIVGGNIKATGGVCGGGILAGCRSSLGTLVVLPPAIIDSKSSEASVDIFGDKGVFTKLSVLYLGDPNQKKLTVSANPNKRPNVNVLFDASGDAHISSALTLAGISPNRWFAGTTGSNGVWQTTGKIAGNVKIYSDTPTLSGQYYSSKRVSVPGTADVHVTLEEPDMSNPFILVTQNVTAWTNGSVTLTAKFNPAVPNLVRIREQGGTWQSISSITKTVSSNGTHYFEAENEDGNTMTISHTVTNIDKAEPTLNVS